MAYKCTITNGVIIRLAFQPKLIVPFRAVQCCHFKNVFLLHFRQYIVVFNQRVSFTENERRIYFANRKKAEKKVKALFLQTIKCQGVNHLNFWVNRIVYKVEFIVKWSWYLVVFIAFLLIPLPHFKLVSHSFYYLDWFEQGGQLFSFLF